MTFHAISLMMDVARGKLREVPSLPDVLLYVAFFPQLIAGPILRASQFMPQLYTAPNPNRIETSRALMLIAVGLFKKVVIANSLATLLVDDVFTHPAGSSASQTLLGIYGYAAQIYCDFSGYTDIAIGCALLLGYRFPDNFNNPYRSATPQEFWRRWHISLSIWLREYLFIPLGGSREGQVRTLISLMLTMLLGGLWHGASWKFLIWGGMHGLALAIHKFWQTGYGKFSFSLPNSISWFITLHFALLCWLPFRAESVESALLLSNKLLLAWHLEVLPEIFQQYKLSLILLLAGFGIHFLPNSIKNFYTNWFEKIPVWLMGLVVVFSIFIIYQFKVAESQPFIYFQF
jgi:D-alanyl-lipoteichoic acid acyltransferase DltB (MBOAT superfamily)